MTIINLSDSQSTGNAAMQNGDFLTFDGLVNNRFSLIIPELPNVQFFLQSFSMPNIVVRQVEVRTRIVDYNEIGEKLDFEPFSLTFLVDKYSRNWASVFNWMKEMSADGTTIGKSSDVVLMIDGKEFCRFIGSWPTSLSGYQLDSTVEGLVYVKATLTLNYDYMDYIGDFKTADSQYT